MYLKSFKIENFRKFRKTNNIIEFVQSSLDTTSTNNEGINIATSTTLIVGKNNSGKTTIGLALDKICKNTFYHTDFNLFYLRELLQQYKDEKFELFPELSFQLIIEAENKDDLMTNLIPFMYIGNLNIENENKNKLEVVIDIKYSLKEQSIFIDEVKKISKSDKNRFNKFLDLLSHTNFKLKYYKENEEITDFKLDKLLNVKILGANKNIDNGSLSKIFGKIIKLKYENINNHGHKNEISEKIENINLEIDKHLKTIKGNSVENIIEAIQNKEHLNINLTSDLTFEKLMANVVKYQYQEKDLCIPESQFGLGYSNLMMIIGELIEYVEEYPEQNRNSKINMIFIEEPEAFMHIQMQELFIKNINDAFSELLKGSNKRINSQLIITTHSSHILNSKIHTGNSFNNINYVTTLNSSICVEALNDNKIIRKINNDIAADSIKFLKKHIKYKVSELFFSDAVILVEGVTEETLLNYFIDNDPNLSKYYISIFNINGAHGLVYHSLIKLLKIPSLIITDLDIKREKHEKNEGDRVDKCYAQITSLSKRLTTNKTLVHYNKKEEIGDIRNVFIDENLYITTQFKKIGEYYASSFEEALILENFSSDVINNALKETKPEIYKEIVGETINKNELLINSFKLQSKLSKSKSDFSNNLLYYLLLADKPDLELPNYIKNALEWLKKMIGREAK